ncbi:MAG: DUF5343 domain-containing protein [Chloroflexi bacterium]|nr:DUF5343 domain-containing protein [Chloroflexota bacterium]
MPERTSVIPPYVPYRTFRNFLEILLKEGIPARIDRSVWGERVSGSNGIQLMTALKVLGLVNQEGRPSADLERLVKLDGDPRRRILRSILERHYGPVMNLDLPRATKSQFRDVFRMFGTNEAVLAKCERFFVQAALDAGIELSPYVLDRRRGARRQAAPRPKATAQAAASVHGRPSPGLADHQRSIASMFLDKYPQFDPGWAPAVQEKWFEGITRLYEDMRGLEVRGQALSVI